MFEVNIKNPGGGASVDEANRYTNLLIKEIKKLDHSAKVKTKLLSELSTLYENDGFIAFKYKGNIIGFDRWGFVSENGDLDLDQASPEETLIALGLIKKVPCNKINKQKKCIVYEINNPGEESAGIRPFTETITVTIDSGNPGGELGEFEENLRQYLSEWYETETTIIDTYYKD